MRLCELNFRKSFEKLGEGFFAKCKPVALDKSKVVAVSKEAADLIGLDIDELWSENFSEFILGKIKNEKYSYLAQVYAGHQFGNFVDVLGDGRALLLAEIENQKNEKWDLVLKGCGITPYSRTYIRSSDGRAALRSSIREFLISESLYHLNIPTSRALCLVASDEVIVREKLEKAAQVVRIAPSHIRFGTFEFFFYRKENDKVKILADYIIEEHFSEIKNSDNKYASFLLKVVESTAKMIAKWQAFGFCHGVMNTDNMSIHGISFDFGPFGFLDNYNPNHICNSTDVSGRYSFINQPFIGFWNLNAFAITLSSLISIEEQKEILGKYENFFLDEYHNLMSAKLGFENCDLEVQNLIYELLEILEKSELDYTNFFVGLSNVLKMENYREFFVNLGTEWFKFGEKYLELLIKKDISDNLRLSVMNRNNPKFILRNYLLQRAIIKAENNDYSEIQVLQKLMKNPFEIDEVYKSYYEATPKNERAKPLSCSS
ncbi:MAG: YdiU family protein [Pelagibacterales bacterium]|nr:YdiU family protein [Pelagibacterales bacterium]